jgi:ubiquinone biosynthesis O-methyltransferase
MSILGRSLRVRLLVRCQWYSTVDPSETEKFSLSIDKWWNELDGPAAPLHSMNGVRVPVIKEALIGTRDVGGAMGPHPLDGYSILDIGCGGGILSESLARLGARVTGIDPNPTAIEVSTSHASSNPSINHLLNYKCCRVEDMDGDMFDCVVASEVIEHVADVSKFISHLSHLTKPNGVIFISTINRTTPSLILAKVFAEYVMGIIPRGTHEWGKFVTPSEVKDHLTNNGVIPASVQGLGYNPFTNVWFYSDNDWMNYCLYGLKESSITK